MISSNVLAFIYENFGHKLNDMNQVWLAPNKLQEYAMAIHNKGAPLQNC